MEWFLIKIEWFLVPFKKRMEWFLRYPPCLTCAIHEPCRLTHHQHQIVLCQVKQSHHASALRARVFLVLLCIGEGQLHLCHDLCQPPRTARHHKSVSDPHHAVHKFVGKFLELWQVLRLVEEKLLLVSCRRSRRGGHIRSGGEQWGGERRTTRRKRKKVSGTGSR